MERVELRTESRTVTGKQVKQLRSQHLLPAVVYGPDTPPLAIQSDERGLYDALGTAGSTALINLFVDDNPKPTAVLARDIQRDVLTGRVLHVDFYQVRLTETVKTTPRIEFVGEAPVAKSGEGVLIHNMTEIEVECLPGDLINSIVVDVSVLATLDDSILVRDLPVPPGITLLADPDEVVVSSVTARVAEEEEEEGEGILFEDDAEAEALAED